MPLACCVRKRVKRVARVRNKIVARYEYGAARAERYVAAAVCYRARADSRGGIVACAGCNDGIWQIVLFLELARDLIALKKAREPFGLYGAYAAHFLRPALVFNVKQQHTRSIRVIA